MKDTISAFYLYLQIHLEKVVRAGQNAVEILWEKNVDFEEKHIEQGPYPLDSSVPQIWVGFWSGYGKAEDFQLMITPEKTWDDSSKETQMWLIVWPTGSAERQ